MKNSILKNTLYNKVVGIVVLIFICTCILITGANYYQINNNLQKNFEEISSQNLGRISTMVESIYKGNKKSLEVLSMDTNLLNIIQGNEQEQGFTENLNNFIKKHDNVASAYFAYKNKKLIIKPDQNIPKDFDPNSRQWYKKAVEEDGKTILTLPYKDAVNDKIYTVTIARTVKDTKGNFIGVIGIDISLKELCKEVQNITVGKNGFSAIVDNSGNIIVHKDEEKIGKNASEEKWLEDILKSDKNSLEEKIDNKEYIVFKEKEENSQYTILGIIPKEELTGEIWNIIKINIIITLLIIILSIFFIGAVINKNVRKPINKIIEVLRKMSHGDFTNIIVENKNTTLEMSNISKAINESSEKISYTLNDVLQVSHSLKEASESMVVAIDGATRATEEIANSMQSIANGTVQQNEEINKTVEIVDNLNNSVELSMNKVSEIMKVTGEADKNGKIGIEILEKLKEDFEEDTKANKELMDKVTILSDKSLQISSITDAIKGITSQTNLLALNASIEAARAGEAGRGFAVVAEQVKKLAEESSNSAMQIEKMINEISISIKEVGDGLQKSIELSKKTGGNIEDTSESFNNIEHSVALFKQEAEDINELLNVIKEDKDTIYKIIMKVNDVCQNNAAATEEVSAAVEEESSSMNEISAAAESLDKLAEELKEEVGRFKI